MGSDRHSTATTGILAPVNAGVEGGGVDGEYFNTKRGRMVIGLVRPQTCLHTWNYHPRRMGKRVTCRKWTRQPYPKVLQPASDLNAQTLVGAVVQACRAAEETLMLP